MMYVSKEWGAASTRDAAMLGVFDSAERAEQAIDKLERAGFDTSQLSVIGKEEPSAIHQIGVAIAGTRAKVWGQRSTLWDRLADEPAALAFTWVPFIGYIVAIGPAARVLVAGHWQALVNTQSSALGRMLALTGMSAAEMRTYEAAVRGGQILLLLHGSAADAIQARHLIRSIAPAAAATKPKT